MEDLERQRAQEVEVALDQRLRVQEHRVEDLERQSPQEVELT